MIDAQAPVLLPGAGLIIPERVLAGRIVDGPQCVGEPEAEQRLKALAGRRAEQSVIDPALGIIDIPGRRNDVEVAGQNQRLLRLEALARIFGKPRHPFELVWIFITARRVAVGQIEAGDAYHAALQCHDALQKTRMGVLVIAGKARLGLVERQLRQQRHAIERLLAVRDHVVAERLDLKARERLVDAFDLLQADDVRRTLLQPSEEMFYPLPDRIDVPGRDAHARNQTEKLVPQPQDAVAFGLCTRNDAPIKSSTKSTSDPARNGTEAGSTSTTALSRSITRSSSALARSTSNLY